MCSVPAGAVICILWNNGPTVLWRCSLCGDRMKAGRLDEASGGALSVYLWDGGSLDVIPLFRSHHDLPPKAGIYVYGTGQGGRALADYLTKAGRPPRSFLDSFQGGMLDDREILVFPAQVSALLPGEVILIASSFRRDIQRVLSAWPMFDCRDAYPFASSLVGERDRLLGFAREGGISLVL